jgi:hypothetical protein
VNVHSESLLLDEFVLGTLDDAAAAHVAAHLESCGACRMEYDELRAVIDVLPQALPAPPPPRALRERIFAALDAPRPERRALVATRALAASLVVALLGDAILALRLQRHAEVAFIAPQTQVSAERGTTNLEPSPARVAPAPSARPTPPAARVAPAPSARPVPRAARPPLPQGNLAAEASVATLARELNAARAEAGANRTRVRELERALVLARAHPRVVTVVLTPPPVARPALARATPAASASPPAAPIDPQLVDALRTGKVYAIDGAVGGEPWHLTIVQPRDGSHALVYSGTPHAPDGDTYRTWVVRDGRTVEIGELPPGEPATLEMPMSLEAGDVVAFSRESLGDAQSPTLPFLMQFKIPQ